MSFDFGSSSLGYGFRFFITPKLNWAKCYDTTKFSGLIMPLKPFPRKWCLRFRFPFAWSNSSSPLSRIISELCSVSIADKAKLSWYSSCCTLLSSIKDEIELSSSNSFLIAHLENLIHKEMKQNDSKLS